MFKCMATMALWLCSLFCVVHSAESAIDITQLDQQVAALYQPSIYNPSYEDLFYKSVTITKLQKQVTDCINISQQQLTQINQLLQANDISTVFKPGTTQNIYLQNERIRFIKQNAYCEFYNYRLQELNKTITAQMQAINTNHFLQKTTPVRQIWSITPVFSYRDKTHLFQFFDLQRLINNRISIAVMGLLCLMTAAIIFLVHRGWLAQLRLPRKSKKDLIFYRIDIIFFIPSLIFGLFLNVMTKSWDMPPLWVTFFNVGLLYWVIILLIKTIYFFSQRYDIVREKLNDYLVRFLLVCSILMATVFIVFRIIKFSVPSGLLAINHSTYVIVIIFILLNLHAENIQESKRYLRFLYSLIGLLALKWFYVYALGYQMTSSGLIIAYNFLWNIIWNALFLGAGLHLLHNKYKAKQLARTQWYIYNIIFCLFYLILIVLNWNGYQTLAMLLVPNIIATVIVCILFYRVSKLVGRIYQLLSDPKYEVSKKFHRLINIEPTNKLIELFVLRIIFNIPIVLLALGALLEFWGITYLQVTDNFLKIRAGYQIMGFTIHPFDILRAANLFCFLSMFFRVLIASIYRRFLTKLDRHTQLTVSSVMHYIGFMIAFLIALIVAGVNFKGIAVIAGALSVGLGFGLQHFVSDFVSGILLLINKPVKIGDHVVIDTSEGFIRNIGLLSTQITTLEQTDVIIPNSTLITKSVTNLTFQSNLNYRLNLRFTLTKLSQLQAAQAIILETAKQNSGVLQEAPNEPVTLFEMNRIELWCVLRDVNAKSFVSSELYLAILTRLKEQNIDIATPAA